MLVPCEKGGGGEHTKYPTNRSHNLLQMKTLKYSRERRQPASRAYGDHKTEATAAQSLEFQLYATPGKRRCRPITAAPPALRPAVPLRKWWVPALVPNISY